MRSVTLSIQRPRPASNPCGSLCADPLEMEIDNGDTGQSERELQYFDCLRQACRHQHLQPLQGRAVLGNQPLTPSSDAWPSPRRTAARKAFEPSRLAQSPIDIPWRGWISASRRALWQMLSDRMSLVSGGCAFYAT